jgi:AcrR family transcriptional regulator
MTADERRDAILAAAMPLFATKGFDAVTTREVAEAAGVSEALLYRHFEGKRALYDAIQNTCVLRAAADAQLVAALPDNTSTLVLAAYLVTRNIQLGALPGSGVPNDIPPLILRSLLTDGAFAQAFLASSSNPWIEKIERCVVAAHKAGDMTIGLPTARAAMWFAHHLAAAINFFRLPGASVLDYYGDGQEDPERLFHDSMEFVLRGMGLTAEAIATHYNPKAFAALAAR